jgi:hypothetical protein
VGQRFGEVALSVATPTVEARHVAG